MAAYAGPGSHNRWNYLPIKVSLYGAACSCCARIFVIDEDDAMADKDFVLDRHPFTNKAMRGNFAVAAYARTLLNFDERSDAGTIANLAAVQIYKVMDLDVAAELYVRRDQAELSRHVTERKRRAYRVQLTE